MDNDYQKWIDDNVPTFAHAYGSCSEMTALMRHAFPELTRVRGHYQTYPHWWLTAPNGEIVDPTARQFWDTTGVYHPHNEAGGEPLGRCYNCGEYVWGEVGSVFCSEACRTETAAHMKLARLRADTGEVDDA